MKMRLENRKYDNKFSKKIKERDIYFFYREQKHIWKNKCVNVNLNLKKNLL